MSDRDELITRLKKIEGQMRGIQKMVEDDRECSAIITQVVAASKALDKVGQMITRHSLKECIAKSVATGKDPEEVMNGAIEMLFGIAKRGV